jgi:hypothetical protein
MYLESCVLQCHHLHLIHDSIDQDKKDFAKHMTLIIIYWKSESRKLLRENKLPSSSNSKLDIWFIFLMLQIHGDNQ